MSWGRSNPFKGGGDQTQITTGMEVQKRHKKLACLEEHSYFSFVWHIWSVANINKEKSQK